MKLPWLFVVSALLGVAAFVAYGCGTDKLGSPESAGLGNTPTGTGAGGCSDGQTRDCHRLIGEHGGVRSCANGTQTCKAGAWSECGGANQSISTLALPPGAHFLGGAAPAAGGLHALSLSSPSPDAGICASNPCDAYCMGFDECDGGASCTLVAEGGPPPNFAGNPGNGGIPAGQESNLFQDDTYGSLIDNCARNPMFSHCQADTYCWPDRDMFSGANTIIDETTPPNIPPGNNANCTHFTQGNHYTAATCPGVDLTVQIACAATGTIPPSVPAGNSVVPICNRGNAAMPATTGVGLTFVASAGAAGLPRDVPPAACFTSTTADCTVDLPALAPGECYPVDIAATTCGSKSGLNYYSVNQNSAVAECGLDNPYLRTPQATQLGCADNWSGANFSSVPNCTSYGAPSAGTATSSQTYTAVCSNPSTAPQWTLLTYDTGGAATVFSNASGSGSLIIKASTATALGGPYGTVVTVVDACDSAKANCVAAVSPPVGDPGQCLMTGPATCPSIPDAGGPAGPCCPKSLFTALGATEANNAYLKLDFTANTTPDGAKSPTLKTWSVAYSCVAVK